MRATFKLLIPLLLLPNSFMFRGLLRLPPVQPGDPQTISRVGSVIRNGPVPLVDLANLIGESELVAVAEVISISDLGRPAPELLKECQTCGPQRLIVMVLHVERLISGQPSGSDISVRFLVGELPDGSAEYSGPDVGEHRIFFLRTDVEHNYTFGDEYYPFLVANREAPAEIVGGTAYDRVVAEITKVLNSPSESSDNRVRAISALEYAKTRMAIASLRRAALDTDVTVKFQAMGSLFRHNDITMLDTAVDTILSPPTGVEKYLIYGLGAGIRARVTDPSAVPALTRLLNSPKAEHRKIAVDALNRTGAAGAKALTKALDDGDQGVRYAAVTGLATITGETDGMPSLELFQKNEQHYLNHWRERMRKKN